MEATNRIDDMQEALEIADIKRHLRESLQKDKIIKHLRDLFLLHFEKSQKTIEELTNSNRTLKNRVAILRSNVEGLEEEIVRLKQKNKFVKKTVVEMEEYAKDPYSDISVSTDISCGELDEFDLPDDVIATVD